MTRRVPLLLAFLLIAIPVQAQGTKTSRKGLKYHLMSGGGGGRKPLIIFLHGTGGNAMVWSGWASAARQRGYICALPYSTGDGKGDPKSGNRGDNLRRWANVDLPKLADLARELQETQGADPRRTYIAGYSNGGFYAMETGLNYPEIFSAILCIGGGCNVWKFTDAAKKVGCYFIHGTADTSVRFEVGKKAAERLKKAGFEDVVFRKYDGRGHELFEEEIPKFFPWLEKQKLEVTPGANDSIAWRSDLDAALKESEESGKKVLVYAYSKKDADSEIAFFLEAELLKDGGFIKAAESFIPVKIDLEKNGKARTELKLKRTQLAVLEFRRGRLKTTFYVRSPGPVSSIVRRLQSMGKSRKHGARSGFRR